MRIHTLGGGNNAPERCTDRARLLPLSSFTPLRFFLTGQILPQFTPEDATPEKKQEIGGTPWWLLAGQHTPFRTHTAQDRRYTDGSLQMAAVVSTGLSCLNDTC